jgi:hypothetical protein
MLRNRRNKMDRKKLASSERLLKEMTRKEQAQKTPFVPTTNMVKHWYDVINLEVFENKLPKMHEIEVRRRHGCWAEIAVYTLADESSWFLLCINHRFHSKKHFLAVLGHEMIHVDEYIETGRMTHHGESFQKWIPVFARHKMRIRISYGKTHDEVHSRLKMTND